MVAALHAAMDVVDYDSGFSDDSHPRTSSLPTSDVSSSKAVKFTLAQKAHLEYMYQSGMRSTSKEHFALINKAAKDTGLTIAQVKYSTVLVSTG